MIKPKRGRNINRSTDVEHTVVPVNALTLKTLALPNANRLGFTACLPPGNAVIDVRILYAPASSVDVGQARDVLTRDTLGNASLFRPLHTMPTDNVYTGEISAICMAGATDILVTES